MTPLVSVVVTTYNQAAYIEHALESVLGQTYHDTEIIVVDDGSTDGTAARVRRFADRITYLRQQNQGIAASRNAGIRQTRGQLLAFLDGDDVWEPEKLAVQVAGFGRFPDAGLIVVDGVQFDDTGILQPSLIGAPGRRFFGGRVDAVVSVRGYAELLRGNFISTSSQVMVPRPALDAVGMSDTHFRLCSDYDLYLRLARRFPLTLIGQRLARWRYLPTSASGPEETRRLRWTAESITIWKKQLREGPTEFRALTRAVLRRNVLAAAQAACYYGRDHRSWATRYLVRLMLTNPRSAAPLLFLAGLWCPESLRRRWAARVRRGLEA
jgi:glycosyltransferase involved in cell wall biosynthesis